MKNIFLILFIIASITYCQSVVVEIDEHFYPHWFLSYQIYFNELSNGQYYTLYTASETSTQFKILAISSCAMTSENFAGGDRNLIFGTISSQKWYLNSTDLTVCGSNSFTTVNQGLGFKPSLNDLSISPTSFGENIVVYYDGGTTDYTSGYISVFIYIFERNHIAK